MGRNIAPTHNRKNVYYFVTRAKDYHASVSATYEVDATPLIDALAAARDADPTGARPSITAALVKATALVIAQYPRLNRHFYHGLLGRFEHQPDGVHCGLLVSREAPSRDGVEEIILPAVIRDADRRSIPEIDAAIRAFKAAPLDALPEWQKLQRLRHLPTAARALIAFGARTHPRVQEKVFGGTYALSSIAGGVHARMVSTHAVSPTGASFLPGTIADRPWVVDGRVVVRKVLPMTIVLDHYVADGVDSMRAMERFGALLSSPEELGLPRVDGRAAADAGDAASV